MAVPSFFKLFAIVWFKFSYFLGEFVSRILLGVVYFLIITPISLFVKDKDDEKDGSTFKKRDKKFEKEDLLVPY